MVSDKSLDDIATYATVLGPWKNTLFMTTTFPAAAAAGGGANPVLTSLEDSGLAARAQDRGLVVGAA